MEGLALGKCAVHLEANRPQAGTFDCTVRAGVSRVSWSPSVLPGMDSLVLLSGCCLQRSCLCRVVDVPTRQALWGGI